jgi:hypothetical protein
MDYKLLAFSSMAVFGVLLVSGVIVSLVSTQLQCSKTGVSTAFKQGAISAVGPTIVYAITAVFLLIRDPYSRTFQSFGIEEETSRILAVGYLTMLTTWITSVQNVHSSEKTVCQTDVKEMTDFKRKMLAELAEKEKQKEANAKK